MSGYTPSEITTLVESLSSNEPVTRQHARDRLVVLGGPEATLALVRELVDPRQHVRWEAAKPLAAIANPIAAPALMHALDDEDEDVRWVAGEGLIAMGKDGLLAVLNGLTKRARSCDYCKGAHHVLHDLKARGFEGDVSSTLAALESPEPAVAAPPAALAALIAIKTSGDSQRAGGDL